MFCDSCGAQNEDDADFCTNCGHKLAKVFDPVEAQREAPKVYCTSCGAPNEPGGVFCERCGTRLDGSDLSAETNDSSGIDTGSAIAIERSAETGQWPGTNSRSHFCLKCGAHYEPGSMFCEQCGAPFDTTENGAPKKQRSLHPAAIAGIAAAIVLACGGVAIAGMKTNWFGLAPAQQEQSSASPNGERKPDGSKVTVIVSDDKHTEPIEPEETKERDDVKSSVDEYSWAELKEISGKITAAGSKSDAVAIAAKYNLCNASGDLTQMGSKTITLVNGKKCSARIVGIYHDVDAGGNKIGLTFLFDQALGLCPWNYTDDNKGGWEGSIIRKSISTEFYDLMPSDLTGQITPAKKYTNNRGGTNSGTMGAEVVTATKDALWIPSFVEISGIKDGNEAWNAAHGTAQYTWCNAVTEAEGTQYEIFAQCNVSTYGTNGVLERAYNGSSCDRWVRSANPHLTYDCLKVSANGAVSGDDVPTNNHGVVIGFCI